MFKLIKRLTGGSPAPASGTRPAKTSKRSRGATESGPLPLPEVVAEGNTEADWSAWEDSKMAYDSAWEDSRMSQSSQFGGLQGGYERTQPADLDDDPFRRVGKNRDL